MTTPPVIRPARDHDRDFVASLASALLEFGSPAWDSKEKLRAGFADALGRAVVSQSARARVLIAESGDQTPVGFISLVVRQDVTGAERGHIADVAVIPAARRTGVGQALVQAGEDWARERGLTILGLDVWSTNERALAFYERTGYRPESLSLIKRID
jgi:ribosomal protein S18 acetylase RimI-like enzyme